MDQIFLVSLPHFTGLSISPVPVVIWSRRPREQMMVLCLTYYAMDRLETALLSCQDDRNGAKPVYIINIKCNPNSHSQSTQTVKPSF